MNYNPDAAMVQSITGQDPEGKESANYCTPDMIAKYVEKLRKEEKKNPEYHLKKGKQMDQKLSHEREIYQKKLQQMQTKSVYAICATFSEELGLLALALIDKEIKLYKIKQNGSKINFVEYFSFHARYYTTCMAIANNVENSRPILCMGSMSGKMQIYYLDEPIIDPMTRRPYADGRVRERQHERSPFNFFFRS